MVSIEAARAEPFSVKLAAMAAMAAAAAVAADMAAALAGAEAMAVVQELR